MLRYIRSLGVLGLVFALASCGGGGGGSGTVTLPGGGNGGGGGGGLPTSVATSYGNTVGVDNTFTPNDGDTSSGGQGQTVDGIPCLPTMDNADYHVHAFLGFIVNGVLTALPDGTGMENPGPDSSVGVTSTATCFYYMHTHDAAGVIHIEDPSKASRTTSIHTLGQYLDIWGHSLSGMTIYTSGARYQGQGDQSVSNTTYSLYTGDPRSIPLYAHEVIWAISGSPSYSASQLPSVHFSY